MTSFKTFNNCNTEYIVPEVTIVHPHYAFGQTLITQYATVIMYSCHIEWITHPYMVIYSY